MFDPSRVGQKEQEGQITKQIQAWAMELLPEIIKNEARSDAQYLFLNVREVMCGDPTCAPIDTVIAFIFRNGRRAMSGIPLEMKQVRKEDIKRTINDMNDELIACHENREYTQPGQLPAISAQGEMALQRIVGVLRRELLTLNATDVVGVCASAIDFLEQIEEDATKNALALARGGPRGPQIQPGPNNARGLVADPSAKILAATQRNDVAAVRTAITEEKISPSYANALGQSPLHIASMWGNVDVAQLLLEHGANVNATNQLSSSTPLHTAASSNKDLAGRTACARLLLQAGADATKTDADGFLPYQKASPQDAPELFNLLKTAALAQSAAPLSAEFPQSPNTIH